jgi:RNA polymerase sigma-70 factor (ECF subfamily)
MTDRQPPAQTQDVGSRSAAQPSAPAAPDFPSVFVAEASYVACSVRRLGVDERDVEDLTHDVFLVAYRHFADYDAARPIRPWLFGIAVRVVLAYRRKAGHQREVMRPQLEAIDEQTPVDEQLAAQQARALVLRALDAIASDRRPVFIMHDIDGHPMPDIAEALAIPLNTGYSRLRLARQDFAAAVERLKRGAP